MLSIPEWKTTKSEALSSLIDAIQNFMAIGEGYALRWPLDAVTDAYKRRWNDLVYSIAVTMEVPDGFLSWACRACPPGNDPVLDERILKVLATVTDCEDGYFGEFSELVDAWIFGGGQAPANIRELLGDPQPLSWNARRRYLVARNEGDLATQERLVAADLAAGCPSSLLDHLDRVEAPEDSVREALGQVDARDLQQQARWGDLTQIAVFLAARGWYGWAHEWSDLVLDADVAPLDESSRNARYVDEQRRRHSDDACMYDDVRLFAPLAFIDLLAGDTRRAAARAVLDGDAANVSWYSWAHLAHFALAGWVRSRVADGIDQRLGILKSVDSDHTWLGLLQAQIYADRAEIAELQGHQSLQADLLKAAEKALTIPGVNLHMGGAFPYNDLLRQLPYPRAAATTGPAK